MAELAVSEPKTTTPHQTDCSGTAPAVWLVERPRNHLGVSHSDDGAVDRGGHFSATWSLYLSLTKYSVINDANTGPLWIGIKNYASLLTDEDVWQRFVTTARFVIPRWGLRLLLGFGLAMLLNRKFRGRDYLMTVMLIPMMLSPLVVALFWGYMYSADAGVIDYFIPRCVSSARQCFG